jgi:transposase
MSQKLDTSPAVIGIDIGKNSFHIVGQNQRGAIVLRKKWSRGQVEARLANLLPCRIGMEACVGAHRLRRTLKALGHDARLMPAKYVRPYSKGQKNDYRDAEAIAEAVPTRAFSSFALKRAICCQWRPRLPKPCSHRPGFGPSVVRARSRSASNVR